MNSVHQLLLFAAGCLCVLFYHLSEVDSANCASYSAEDDCEDASGCAWSSSSGCYCTSNVTMDICFALDSSGSIGSSYFEIELDWLSDFVGSSLSTSARVGIINFSTYAYMIMNFSDSESYSTSQLQEFIEDIYYYGDFTNTVDAIREAIIMFEKESSDKKTKVFIIMTDGNPKLPNGGDTDVCQYASTLKSDDISTYILGVGDNWNPDNVDCLVDDEDNDIIYVTSFNYSEFDKILPQLTDVTCPVSYEATITEIKVLSDGTDEAVPFIEIYNPSNEIKLKDLTFEGIVNGEPVKDNTTLPQGSYLILYDASYSGGGANVTCEECDCTHYARGSWCSSAVYIGCDGSSDHPCSFDSSYSNTGWELSVTDNTADDELDSVTWDSTFPNLTSLVGYSYELKYRGYDNDQGSNWDPSCNIYGSPGTGPLTNCTQVCSLSLCTAGGASSSNVEVDGDECDCDGAIHYYSDGCSCNLVPPPSNCTVTWVKNGTSRYYKFEWERANTDDDHRYYLGYYVNGNLQYVTLYPKYKVVTDFDTSIGYDATAGTVQTYMQSTYSRKTNCTSITQSPTESPTPSPTMSPSAAPTDLPTQSPTFSSPYLYLGGDICEEDRCDCSDDASNRDCEGDEVSVQWTEGTQKYVTVEQRPLAFPATTLVYWDIEYMGTTDTDNGTQIAESRRMRRARAMRRILSEKYNKEVSLDEINYLSSGGSSQSSIYASTVEPSTTYGDAGDDITPVSGYVNVSVKYSDAAETDASGNYGKIGLYVADNAGDDSDYELFKLTLQNCSVYSQIYNACDLVYPYSLYIIIENTGNGLNSSVTEEEMPAWLWWVIVALVIFLFVLGWLVYRYWWKNKQTNSALAETQDELDQAIEEADLGFGHDLGQGDVGFNPLATGVPGTMRPTDQMGANLANRQNQFANDKADVQVEKFREKEQFGQVKPNRRGNDLAEPFLS